MMRWVMIVAVSGHLARGFVVPTTSYCIRNKSFDSSYYVGSHVTFQRTKRTLLAATTRKSASPDDPFELLNLKPDPSLDKKAIKRAYKRMALKYHPDVVTNQSSTPQEKKKANDDFAKINWAYATLSGKGAESNSKASSSSSSSSSASGTTGGYGYTPPHRRTSSYNQRSSNGKAPSTDWRDYMPNYDQEEAEYDANGDSLGSIFSDMFSSAAGAAGAVGGAVAGRSGGSNGVFRDFVEFLERNVDGYDTSNGADNDAELRVLLQTGSFKEIRMEMDDTDLVVQQLSSKADSIDQDLQMVQADAKVASRSYPEKIELEEKEAELQARKTIVQGYQKKARKRLIKLQTRYKELVVNGEDDEWARGNGKSSSSKSSSWDDTSTTDSSSGRRADAHTNRSSNTGPRSSGNGGATGSSEDRTNNGDNLDEDEDAWKRQGFGSSARGRGSGRGSSRRRRPASGQRDSASEPQQQEKRTQESYERTRSTSDRDRADSTASRTSRTRSTGASSSTSTSNSTTTSPQKWTPPVPPHRRTTSAASQAQEDKRRLRDLRVDDEFEKLKKDLGL